MPAAGAARPGPLSSSATACRSRCAVPVGIDRIVELAVPFDALGVKVGEPVQFFRGAAARRARAGPAPREGVIALNRPSADFEHIMWDV